MEVAKLLRFYPPRGLKIVKAYMQYVWDENWRKYLDFYNGYGVGFLGHRNPIVVAKVVEQLGTLVINSPSFDDPVKEELLNKLPKILPKTLLNVYFQNSGTEAVELALKLSFYYTKRKKVVAFKRSFHGRTLGSLSVTWGKDYRAPVEELLLKDVVFAEFNSTENLDKVIDEDTAAVIVEPVQGEGGINPATREFLMALRNRTKEVGAVLIFDEIQAGFGRTGSVWAYQGIGASDPDVLLSAKAIGNGIPVSMVAVNDEIAESVKSGIHGSTYGANPLALAAVSGAIDVLLKDNVPQKAKEKGKLFDELLREEVEGLRIVREIRNLGLMIGVELRVKPGKYIEALQREGVLSLKAGATVIRFLPPYVVTEEDIRTSIEKLKKVLNE
ncbi:acetyl-lysine aminotransferase [Ignicoccus islandicus DSM 13165]|uniref:Putative [LysW]-aminoadipate semialdehyde/glutamate semialdehyde transaminase n=1 Tax=Ignicoccus islandicus DSM 13165 TaxID=940295 RepID=A0A0U3FHY4_9CREN|nr:aspartate aminotransferase family protein [Ignicoccus islandicus]ALU11510.1 acetyl-lysine aminotransferase [Ignicoccus islandicus DSM 13165]